MTTNPVAFVAFAESENLGIGYISAVLSENGYDSVLIDFRDQKEEILRELKEAKPLIVGFSVIFQYHIDEFARLISFLRQEGIKCHFSAGGQYGSLKYQDLFNAIPELDSIVRFDGEYTFLELVKCISAGIEWKNIEGIAYQEKGNAVASPKRQIETDLDKYPIPYRPPLKEYVLEKKFATILAGRGCVNNCIYCYLREYSRQSTGPYKRIRDPEKVVAEMEILHNSKHCSVFLFEDDDFPVKTGEGSTWIQRFCEELDRKKLTAKIMWKINCRPDEVDPDIFSMMKQHGMFSVFLGIEDGTDEGLKHLNKNMTISKCLEGINILKRLEIGFDYGFMLFQPTSTFKSVNDNLSFLRKFCADGYTPVSFLKMMPYNGTLVEKQLRKEGRLTGKPGFLDYNFLEKPMDDYYNFITDSLREWFRDSHGVLNITKWARNYISVFSRFYEKNTEIRLITEKLKKLISESNILILDSLEELALLFESGNYKNINEDVLKAYREMINLKHNYYKQEITDIILKIGAYQHYHKYMQPFLYGD